MIFTVPLQANTLLANVAYKWIVDGVMSSELTDGITQPSGDWPMFRIDATPPDLAEELIVYDSTALWNWNPGQMLLSKLRIGVASTPVIVIPAPPGDVSLCRVYGYLETLDNQPAANVNVTFELISLPSKSERILSGHRITVKTDDEGRVTNANGDAWIDLQRNDLITPAGTVYHVTCVKAGMEAVEMTLDDDLFDLSTLIV